MPLGLVAIGILTALLAAVLTADRLPSLAVLTDYRPKVPMHVYTADGLLIGEFGEERRSVVRIEDFPERMTKAILAAEDDSFYEHSGVDVSGIVRAAIANLRAGGRAQGASTITMQLARNFFLTRERSYVRKIYEVLLTWKIEQALTKDQILEIYANQIFLGQRSYGFGAAAETYFGKPLAQLSVAQMAMLAGLPKAPARDNPIVNPKRAKERQLYVLSRMHQLGYLDDQAYEAAKEEDLQVLPERRSLPLRAQWASEMARQLTYEMFKDEAYSTGLNVYTTIQSKDQRAANAAVRKAVIDYDRKQGYRGPEAYIEMTSNAGVLEQRIDDALGQAGDLEEYLAAVVLKADPKSGHRHPRARRHLRYRRRRPQVRLALVESEGSLGPADPARRHRADRRRQRRLGDRAGTGGRGSLRRHRHRRRRGPRHGGRLRLQPQQVQPRDPVDPPARVGLQAVHLFGGAGEGLHGQHHHQRRADHPRSSLHRRAALGTEELRRQVRRPDDPEDGAGAVEEHGVDPAFCRASASTMRRTTSPASASSRRRTPPT